MKITEGKRKINNPSKKTKWVPLDAMVIIEGEGRYCRRKPMKPRKRGMNRQQVLSTLEGIMDKLELVLEYGVLQSGGHLGKNGYTEECLVSQAFFNLQVVTVRILGNPELDFHPKDEKNIMPYYAYRPIE